MNSNYCYSAPSVNPNQIYKMTDINKPLIAFDLGAVLIDWDPRYLYRKLFNGDDEGMEHFLAEVCSPAWNVQQDAGRSFAEAIAVLAKQYPEQRELISAYFERWEEMLGGAIEGSVEILRMVKELGFEVAALSNWSAETYPLAHKQFDFLNWFEVMVLSGKEKVVKPDPAIYRILLERTGRQAENCIFIDDSLINVQAARELGIASIHFQSPSQLRKELSSMHPELALLNS